MIPQRSAAQPIRTRPSTPVPIQWYVTLNRFDYTLTVDGNSTSGNPYREILDFDAESWVVRMSDLNLAEEFEATGDLTGIGDVWLHTTANWDYSFDGWRDANQLATVTVQLDYESALEFNWHESLSYDRLVEIGLLSELEDGTISSSHNGQLDMTGQIDNASHGLLQLTETDSGFDYTITGDTQSASQVAGLQMLLDVAGVLLTGAPKRKETKKVSGTLSKRSSKR